MWASMLACAYLLIAFIWRLWIVLPGSSSTPRRHGKNPCKTCIVLGSGGHTSEMIAMTRNLDAHNYAPRTYVIANTDTLSEVKARQLEEDRSGVEHKDFFIHRIPRLREVGQPLSSVPFSVVKALLGSFKILYSMPDLIICNGPGSCISVCMVAYLPRLLGIKHIRIVYIESFARVKSLSVTGRLLYPVVDYFLVQWPELVERYPRAMYNGVLV
ncbi:UDP-N-acetylglucosamine transferase subunit ALG14 [Umbelopsis sp. PMI_123]|nr:UDP-N-acetylglucosamine transferase subunit ALG14 [Umbelopsis sp. PMI_123]